MKDKLKKIVKDGKSFGIIISSFILMALFLVGGTVVNRTFNSLKSPVYNAATDSGFNDEALYTCVVEAYNREHNNASMLPTSPLNANQLSEITELNCSGKGVTNTTGLKQLTSLKKADLSNNEINSLNYSSYNTIPSLEELNLNNNKFTDFHMDSAVVYNLKVLKLANNELNSFEPIHPQIYSNTLEELNLSNNHIKTLDLSNYTKLNMNKTLISGNDFENEVYVYKGNPENVKAKSAVKLPNLDNSPGVSISPGTWTYSSGNSNVAGVNSDGTIVHRNGNPSSPYNSPGDVTYSFKKLINRNGSIDTLYESKCNIHGLELSFSNNKYKEGDGGIWIGSDASKTPNTDILQNMSLGTDKVNISFSTNSGNFIDQEVILKIHDTVNDVDIANIPVFGATTTSAAYNIDSEYLYFGQVWDTNRNIIKVSGSDVDAPVTVSVGLTINIVNMDGKKAVYILKNGLRVKAYKCVEIANSPFDFQVNNNYVWIGQSSLSSNSIDNNNYIKVIGGKFVYTATGTNIYTLTLLDDDGNVIKTWDVVGWRSSKYDLDQEYVKNNKTSIQDVYVNTKNNSWNPNDDITCTGCQIETVRNGGGGVAFYALKYGSLILKKFNDVSFYSNEYDLSKDYVNVGTKTLDTSKILSYDDSTRSVVNDNYLYIVNSDPDMPSSTFEGKFGEIYKKVPIISYSSNRYDLSKSYVYIGSDSPTSMTNYLNGNSNVSFEVDGYQLKIKNSVTGETVEIKDIISCQDYDLSKDYIYVGSDSNEVITGSVIHNPATTNVRIETNTENNVKNSYLVFETTEGIKIKSWKLHRCTSDYFYFGKNYVYSNRGAISSSSTNILNSIVVEGGTYQGFDDDTKSIKIKFDDQDAVTSFPVLYLKPNNSKLDELFYYDKNHSSYAYIGAKEHFDINDYTIHYGADVVQSLPSNLKFVKSTDDSNKHKLNLIDPGYHSTRYIYDWYEVQVYSDEYAIENNTVFINSSSYTMGKLKLTSNPATWTIGVESGNNSNHGIIKVYDRGGNTLSNLKTIYVYSNDYYIGKDYINTKGREFDINKVTVSSAPTSLSTSKSYENGVFTITYDNGSTKSYTIRNTGFADENLYACVVNSYNTQYQTDYTTDRILTNEELSLIPTLYCNKSSDSTTKVTDLYGIEKLTGTDVYNLAYNNISTLDLSSNPIVRAVYANGNSNLNTVNVSNNSELLTLNLDSTRISNLDLSHNTKLKVLNLSNTNLDSLDLSHNSSLNNLNLTGASISRITMFDGYDISEAKYDFGSLQGNQKYINFGNNRVINVVDNYDYSYGKTVKVDSKVPIDTFKQNLGLSNLQAKVYNGTTEVTEGNIKNGYTLRIFDGDTLVDTVTIKYSTNDKFNDSDFYKCVVDAYNSENNAHVGYDELLTDEQLATIKNVSCAYGDNINDKIIDTKGIEYLTGLEKLNLHGNSISEINLQNNVALKELNLSYNANLSNIDVSHNTNLRDLNIQNTNLHSLDLTNNTLLENLAIGNNRAIDSINLEHNLNLKVLRAENCNISSIDLSNNTKLNGLVLFGNQLTSLDLSNNKELTSGGGILYINDNPYSMIINTTLGVATKIEPPVKLPEGMSNDITYSYLPRVATIESDTLTPKITGSFTVGAASSLYNFAMEVNVDENYYSAVEGTNIDLSKEYIDGTHGFDLNYIKVPSTMTVGYSEDGKKVQIVYDGVVVKEWTLLGFVPTYPVTNDTIYINSDSLTEEQFKDSIKPIVNLEVVFQDNNSDGFVNTGDQVTFTNTDYGISTTLNVVVQEIDISKVDIEECDYADATTGTTINGIIKRIETSDGFKYIEVGTKLSDITSKIQVSNSSMISTLDVNGSPVTEDRNAKTGDMIVINTARGTINYKVAVRGDVNGNAEIDISDVALIRQQWLGNNVIVDLCKIAAADINNNSLIDISDLAVCRQWWKNDKNQNSNSSIGFIVNYLFSIGGIGI